MDGGDVVLARTSRRSGTTRLAARTRIQPRIATVTPNRRHIAPSRSACENAHPLAVRGSKPRAVVGSGAADQTLTVDTSRRRARRPHPRRVGDRVVGQDSQPPSRRRLDRGRHHPAAESTGDERRESTHRGGHRDVIAKSGPGISLQACCPCGHSRWPWPRRDRRRAWRSPGACRTRGGPGPGRARPWPAHP